MSDFLLWNRLAKKKAGSSTLLQDAFTDSDGTSLDAHTPNIQVGSNVWSEVAGSWQITSNKAILAANSSGAIATYDVGVADQIDISAKFYFNYNGTLTNRFAGLFFRYQDTSNFWLVRMYSAVDQLQLVKTVGGSETPTVFGLTLDPATEYLLKVNLNGNDIKVYVDNDLKISVTDSAHANQTKVGMRLYTGLTDYVDDFLVSRT